MADPVDGTITNPDDALRDALALAGALTRQPPDGQEAAYGRRLGGLVRWLHAHLTRGGPLPTPWAAAQPGGTAPVRDRRLPGDPRPDGGEALMLVAGMAARTVIREHQPHKSRRSRTAAPADFCRHCGQPWPCQARTLAAALRAALPWWHWAAGNADTLRQALFDASCYVDEHGLGRDGPRDYDPVANRLGELSP
jgi:hypothetical protein